MATKNHSNTLTSMLTQRGGPSTLSGNHVVGVADGSEAGGLLSCNCWAYLSLEAEFDRDNFRVWCFGCPVSGFTVEADILATGS